MKNILLLFTLLTFSLNATAAKIDTLFVKSESMNKSIPTIVVKPDNYSENGEKYPVVYLLHGAGDTYVKWISAAPNLKEMVDTYNLIIVCPDGGGRSWYFDSPIDEKMKYETYISKELVTAIDEKYNTIKNRNGRAITGLSMGGHGALYLSFKHQDIWAFAGSMSGGVDLRPFPNNWQLSERLGKYAENKEVWENNSVINMVYLLHPNSLKLIIDCGVDDFFYDANQRLHTKLLERNIPHDYIQRPGKHNWDYWKNAIEYQLLFFNNLFEK